MQIKSILFALTVFAVPAISFASWQGRCNFDIKNDDSSWETDGCQPQCRDYDDAYVTNDNDDNRCEIVEHNGRCSASMRSRDGSNCRVKFTCEYRCRN